MGLERERVRVRLKMRRERKGGREVEERQEEIWEGGING
jgi:hypothetical protein